MLKLLDQCFSYMNSILEMLEKDFYAMNLASNTCTSTFVPRIKVKLFKLVEQCFPCMNSILELLEKDLHVMNSALNAHISLSIRKIRVEMIELLDQCFTCMNSTLVMLEKFLYAKYLASNACILKRVSILRLEKKNYFSKNIIFISDTNMSAIAKTGNSPTGLEEEMRNASLEGQDMDVTVVRADDGDNNNWMGAAVGNTVAGPVVAGVDVAGAADASRRTD